MKMLISSMQSQWPVQFDLSWLVLIRPVTEIAWFIVGYDSKPGGWTLFPREVVFTRLDASVKSLTGGVPLSKERFEEQLRLKLDQLKSA
ncbi:MAG: hypothetical protein WBW41_18380 [Verrucomicrobiia bacterium]